MLVQNEEHLPQAGGQPVSWRYAVVFTLFAFACATMGVAAVGPTNGLSLTLLYPATSFVLLAIAYGGGGPGLLGKQVDGRRGWPFSLLLAPYLLLTRFSFVCYLIFTKR